jgi:hypothetical protein
LRTIDARLFLPLALAVCGALAPARAPARADGPPLAEASAGSYLVLAEMDEARTRRAALALAAAGDAIEHLFPAIAPAEPWPPGALRVLILADRQRHADAVRARGLEPSPDGAFLYVHADDPRSCVVLAWARSDEREMLRGLAHEALHQRLRAAIEAPAPWLDEGLAVFCERLPVAQPGAVRPSRDLAAATTSTMTIAELLSLSTAEFTRRADVALPLAAHLVGAILGSANAGAIDGVLRAMAPDATEAENLAAARNALDRALPPERLSALLAKSRDGRRD